jgi:hypothetical protein
MTPRCAAPLGPRLTKLIFQTVNAYIDIWPRHSPKPSRAATALTRPPCPLLASERDGGSARPDCPSIG